MKQKYLFEENKTANALPKHQPQDYKIILKDRKEPIYIFIYGLSETELGTLNEYIKENLVKRFIQPLTLPVGYPIIFIPKKNRKLRLYIDYRKFNNITIKNRYLLPNADELRDRLLRAQQFTKLDMRGAYNLIRMAKSEEQKTTFRIRYGSYEYKVMPFGLTNILALYQSLVNDILRKDLDKKVIAYLDDILIYLKTYR